MTSKKILSLLVVMAMLFSSVGITAFAEETSSETPTRGFMIYILNGDGSIAKTINGTKSIDEDVDLYTDLVEGAYVFADNPFLFGISGTPSLVMELYQDAVISKQVKVKYDTTINGNGHNITYDFEGEPYLETSGKLVLNNTEIDKATSGAELPEAQVENLGKIKVSQGEGQYSFEEEYYEYDLIGSQKLTSATEAFDLNIAMQFVSKDTEAEAAQNAYGKYTTDFFIKIDGLKDGSFVGDGCYLAGYYPTFGTWVKIPLDGFTVEDGKVYPVITSAGFDFKYTDICASVKNFICGIYLTPEVIDANPDINVNLTLGLAENMDKALNADFITVDDYTYKADDFIDAVASVTFADGNAKKYETLSSAIAAADETDNATVKVLRDTTMSQNNIHKNIVFDLNGYEVTVSDSTIAFYLCEGASLTIKDSSEAQEGKLVVAGTPYENAICLYEANTTFTLESGNIISANNGVLVWNESAKAFLKGGSITCTTLPTTSRVLYMAAGSVEITGGTYSADEFAGVYGGKISISGGTFDEDVKGYCESGYTTSANSDGTFSIVEDIVTEPKAKIGDKAYSSVASALADAKDKGMKDVTITLVGETTSETQDSFDLLYGTAFDNVTFVQEDTSKPYYIESIYTGDRTAENGKFIFDGVNLVITGQIWFECDVVLKNNATVTRTSDTKNFIYYGDVTIEPGSKFNSQIEDVYAGSFVVDGGRNDGGYNETYDYKSIFVDVRAGQTMTFKNGAYALFNSANEIGTFSVMGTVNVQDSKLEVLDTITVSGAFNVDAESYVKAKKIIGAGTIHIDASNFEAINSLNEGDNVIINADMSGFTGKIEPLNNDSVEVEIVDNKVIIKKKVVLATLSGSGTEADPYLINNIDDLVLFRDSVNAGETKYNAAGVYVALGADIDMAGIDWSVNIGDDCNATFDGIFDGKNHTISNLTATETAQKSDGYICSGLFGAIYETAQIKNLTIENATINAGNYTGSNVGVVVGFAYKDTAAIENVKVIGDIKIDAPKAHGVGTIVGYAYYGNPTIKNCEVNANEGSYINASSEAGGIIGYGGAADVVNCKVENLTIKAEGLIGGIAGLLFEGGSVEGGAVNNVALTINKDVWVNSAAIAVGTISSDGITVSGVEHSNVTENGEATSVMVGSAYAEKPTAVVPAVQAKVGDKYYTTLEAAIAATKNGDTITVIAAIDGEAVEVNKNLTITGDVVVNVVNNVTINAVEGCEELTVKNLSFTGNSWINSGAAGKLTVEGVEANVTPSNTGYTNSRSAFISLGRIEAKELELTVKDCNIVSAGGSNPILGWATITKATLTGNTFGSSEAYQANSDSVKFMAIADGAEFTVTDNTVYSNYNGLVFGQNTTRGNKYTVVLENNKFLGGADHVWIEVSGANTTHATIKASSNNTVNGSAFTANDIKVHPNIKTWTSYAGVDVVTNENGKVIGGQLAFNAEDIIAEGYEKDANGFVVAAVKRVAEVNGIKYETFAAAYEAAKNGDTITLLDDVKLTGKLTIAKEITIDGNGHSIIADETAVWYTVSGKLNIKNYKTHLIGVNSNNITLKNIVLDNNNNAAGINIYCAQNVVFDNVSIINATKGMAALTVNGSTLTLKNSFKALGNSMAIDISNGSGVTSALGVTIEEGTVLDLGDKTVKFASVAVNDMSGAVNAEGKPYFAAMDNAYYYTEAQMMSRTTAYSNGLTLLSDVELTKDLQIKSTLNLNGKTLNLAEGKTIKATGNLTIVENGGSVEGKFIITSATATITAPEGFDVEAGVDGYTVVYSDGKYSLAQVNYVAQVGDTKYTTVLEAIAAANAGETVTILANEITFDKNAASIVIDKAITIEGAGKAETKLIFDSATSAFVIKSSDVTIKNMTIVQGTADNSAHISIDKGAWNAPKVQYSGITIENVEFVEGDNALFLIGENVVVDACTFSGQESHNIVVYSLKGDSKITNNVFGKSDKTNKSAILYEGGADNATDLSGFIGGGNLTISGNEAYEKGTFFQFTNWGLVKNMNVSITDNYIDAFTNKAIAIYDMDGALTAAGDEFASFVINENVFANVPEGRPIVKEYTGTVTVDANGNYLGSAEPDYETLLVGDKVEVENYYAEYAFENGVITLSNLVDFKEAELFGMFRRNMVLGNSLAINIYYKTADITDPESYVIVEQHKEGEVAETKINIAECEQRVVDGEKCYTVSYTGVAACEMSDDLVFTVYNSKDEKISTPYTTSIRGYANAYLDFYSSQSGSEKWMTTFVDMLNYGAAAQETFNYKEEDLANKDIDTYQVYASKTVEVARDFESSESGRAATSLFLRNRVELNAYFTNVTEGMYIEIEYVNYYGETKRETIKYDDMVTRGEYRGATVSTLAIADASSPVKATLFSADGKEEAWVKESVNGYLYRIMQGDNDELYPSLAKFAKAAAESLN